MALQGKHIVVTRAVEQSAELVERLQALGATVTVCPLIAIAPLDNTAPLDDAVRRLAEYDWLLFTSANAVRAFFGRVDAALPEHVKVGAVGPATARALVEHGIAPSFTPSAQTAEALAAELDVVAGQRVLLPSADIARPALADGLRARGALVDVVTVYRTAPGDGVAALRDMLRDGAVDAVLFASPSAVQALVRGMSAAERAWLSDVAVACIGPTTAAAAHEAGLRVSAVAREHTAAGLVAELRNWGTKERVGLKERCSDAE